MASNEINQWIINCTTTHGNCTTTHGNCTTTHGNCTTTHGNTKRATQKCNAQKHTVKITNS